MDPISINVVFIDLKIYSNFHSDLEHFKELENHNACLNFLINPVKIHLQCEDNINIMFKIN